MNLRKIGRLARKVAGLLLRVPAWGIFAVLTVALAAATCAVIVFALALVMPVCLLAFGLLHVASEIDPTPIQRATSKRWRSWRVKAKTAPQSVS